MSGRRTRLNPVTTDGQLANLPVAASPTFTGLTTVGDLKISGGTPGIGKTLVSDIDGDISFGPIPDQSVTVVTGSEARPTTAARVLWVGGTTQPTFMGTDDVWLKQATPTYPTIAQSSFSHIEGTGTQIIATLPSGITSGRTLIMVLNWFGAGTPAGLSGWTQRGIIANGEYVRTAVYSKVAGGSEPSSVTVTGFTEAADNRTAVVLEIANGAYDAIQLNQGTAATPFPISVVNAPTNNSLIIRTCAAQTPGSSGTATWSWSRGTVVGNTVAGPTAVAYYQLLSVAQETQAVNGTSGTGTAAWTLAGTVNYATATIAVKPA